MESARGESCPSGQRRGPVPPGEDKFPSPDQKSIQTTHKPGDENGDPPVRYRPARCGHPNPIGWLLIGWGSWSQRAARVALRADVDVLPHPGRIGSHPRIKNPSKSLQFQQPRDENGDPPRRYRPARCGNPNPNGWLLIGSGSWRQRGSRVAPRANVEIPPNPGRIWFHRRIKNPSIPPQLQQP